MRSPSKKKDHRNVLAVFSLRTFVGRDLLAGVLDKTAMTPNANSAGSGSGSKSQHPKIESKCVCRCVCLAAEKA